MGFCVGFFGVAMHVLHVAVKFTMGFEGLAAEFTDKRSMRHLIKGLFGYWWSFGYRSQSWKRKETFHKTHFNLNCVCLILKSAWLRVCNNKKVEGVYGGGSCFPQCEQKVAFGSTGLPQLGQYRVPCMVGGGTDVGDCW